MSKKKVLVTGSNGLLGQKLTDLLQPLDEYDLIATGRGENRHPNKAINYVQLDITVKANVDEVISAHQPDVVINTAAMTNVDACEEDKEGCDLLNVTAVDYLSSAADQVDARFIHLSTDFIFDGTDGPYSEDGVPNPLSYYGHSKLKGEELVKRNCRKWAILRTVLVYGIVHDMSRSNIVLWAKGALEEKKSINIVDDQFRTPTLAEDLAMGCKLACDSDAQGIYNISGKDFMSIFELVERVAKYYNLSMDTVGKTNSESLNQAAKRPPITGFDLSKSMRELNYAPHSFEEGIALMEKQINPI